MNAFARMETVKEIAARAPIVVVPTAIFIVYVFFLIDYFGRLSARIPAYGQFRPTLILIAVLGFALLTQADKIRHLLGQRPLQLAILLFFYMLITLPFVEWPGSVLRHNIDPFIKAFVFLFFTAMIIDTDRRLKIFVFLFIALQMFRVLEPLLTYMITGEMRGSTYIADGEFAARLSGARADVINANGLGFVIVTTLAFMHFMLGASPRYAIRLLYTLLAPLFIYALVLTGSRGAFVTFLVLALFIIFDTKKKLTFVVIALLLGAVALANLSDFQKERLGSIFSQDTESVHGQTAQGRLAGMKTEFMLGLKRPVFGHGLGTTPEAKVNQLGERNQAAHNLYAELLIEIGVFGAAVFLAYLFSLYKLLRANLMKFKEGMAYGAELDSFQLRLNKALLAVFWVYAVYSVNYFGLSQEYWYLFGGLCIAFARSIERSRSQSQPMNAPGPRGFVPVLPAHESRG